MKKKHNIILHYDISSNASLNVTAELVVALVLPGCRNSLRDGLLLE
jgi:hypothetical protein